MPEIILYTTHCPLCKGLEKSLQMHNIDYVVCTDKSLMKEMGIHHVPMLSVDGQILTNQQALRWVLSQEK